MQQSLHQQDFITMGMGMKLCALIDLLSNSSIDSLFAKCDLNLAL
jgi:hypothetical protein